jgi:proline iminopeptidase
LERDIAQTYRPLLEDHTFIFYQQRGSGASSPATEDSLISARQHVDDLEAVRAFFHLDRLILIGGSWGGGLIALYAASYPDHVERAIQFNSMPLRRPSNFTLSGMAGPRLNEAPLAPRETAYRRWTDRPDSASCTAFFTINYSIVTAAGPYRDSLVARSCYPSEGQPAKPGNAAASSITTYRRSLQSLGNWDLSDQLTKVSAPMLIVRGEEDFFSRESADDYARTYPNARLLSIPNAGHILVPEQPDRFFTAVRLFLTGSWPPDAIQVTSQ